MNAADRVVLTTDIVPSHYDLEIIPDLSVWTFEVREDIVVDVKRDNIKSLTLHAQDLIIKSGSFNGSNEIIGIEYDLKYSTVTLVFENPLEVMTNGKLTLKLTGVLNGDMAGFYRSSYVDANGNKKIMGSTQFEALDARRAFVCWDEPAVKATFNVTLIIDAHLSAFSNMPESEVFHLEKSKKKISFDKTPIMSTYLLAWAVGEFDYISGTTKGGVLLRVITPPGRVKQASFALDCGIKSLDFFSEFFEIPYPLPKLDMLCCTEFAAGAMENWGLVTYRETALMIGEKASSQMKQRVATVIAHELAHQWFGNLVTMAWWDGLWLNEGFARFMEDFCVNHIFPDYKIWDQWAIDTFGAAQRLDSLRSSHPILVPIKHAHEVEQIFDAISYAKGSTVVNMVYQTLGYEHFRRGLQIYFKRHAYGNTETSQLWDAWTEASGVDVNDLMNLWTKRLGYPYLTVTSEKWSEKSVDVTLKQTWFLADGSLTSEEASSGLAGVDGGRPPVWCIPLFFASDSSTSSQPVFMNKLEQSFTIPLSQGSTADFIKINTQAKAFVRVLHSPTQVDRLAAAIAANKLSDVDVASLLLDQYALAKAGIAPIEIVAKILKSINGNVSEDSGPSYIIWTALSSILQALAAQLHEIGGKAYSSFASFAKAKVLGALAIVGWDSKPECDRHTDKLLRGLLISLLDQFASDDAEVVAQAFSRFHRHFEDPTVLPSDYKTTVYKIVLLNGSAKEYEQVLKTFYATEDNQEKKYALFSLGAANDVALKIRTLDWATKSGDVKLQDFFYAFGVVAGGKNSSDLAWKYYKDNFEVIKSKLAKASPSLSDAVIVQSTSHFISLERANEVEEFFQIHPLPASSRRISQTVEVIRSNAKLLEFVKKSSIVSDPSIWD